MNREVFYNALRSKLNLTEQNVFGMEKHLDYAEQKGVSIFYLPKILATSWWESGQTMHPVVEAYWMSETWRKNNLRYYPHHGRGLIQVTWDYNYIAVAKMLGLPDNFFIKNPDALLEWEYALPALFVGMELGIYTGKKLSDYIDFVDESDQEDLREFANARRIVNGTDKQVTIGKLALTFEHALRKAGYAEGDWIQVPEEGSGVEKEKAPTEVKKETEESPLLKIIKYIIKVLRKSNG